MIYSYKDYKQYLIKNISRMPNKGRGVRSQIAKVISAQTAYVSQVLNGDSHFNIEQAYAISEYLNHDREESKYFLLMVQRDRSSNYKLRIFLNAQMDELREQNVQLSKRIEIVKRISLEEQLVYYSTWYYSAIHVALSIPQLQSPNQLASYFGIPIKLINDVLSFLLSCGLAKKNDNHFTIGHAVIHLETNSPIISKLHANWRIKTLQVLEGRTNRKDLLYSSVVTLSKDDFIKIKDRLLDEIKKVKAVIRDSKEEIVCSFNMDFFEVQN